MSLIFPSECAQIKDYIDHHYSEEVTLDDLYSRLSSLNKYYLSHIFSKSCMELPPINYLLIVYLKQQRAFENTDYSITHIAHMTGFSSANYFSQSFKNTPVSLQQRTEKNFKKKSYKKC